MRQYNSNSDEFVILIQLGIKKMNTPSFHSHGFMPIGNYTLCSQMILGKGATGTVFRGYRNQCRTPVAIKAIDMRSVNDEATRSLLQNEKNALKTINSDHIIKLHDILEENNFCYIITQLCEGSTLKDYISMKGKLSEDEAMNIFKKILIGCNAITLNCIIHRDLKPANILIDKELNPTIIDFGFCQIIRAKKVIKSFNVGSPSYMSPEAYLRTLYSQKSDSWSLGMILYEMIHGKTLDEGMNIKDFFELVRSNSNYVLQNLQPGLNNNVREILEKSLKYQTEDRMSISGMKYLCDVFNLKRRNQASNREIKVSHLLNNQFHTAPNTIPPLPKPLPQTLHNISNDFSSSRNNKQGGFISYAEFTKPLNNTGGSFNHRYNKTSQISLSSSSNKNSSINYNIYPKFNENMHFLNIKPPSFADLKKDASSCAFQTLSSKDIIERRPKGPPVYRQVTVRYL